jgi:hypothetical protein
VDPKQPDTQSEHSGARDTYLDRLGVEISTKRAEAVAARKESGIEKVWMRCEESYLGMDDENRSDFTGAKWSKPMSMEGPVTTSNSRGGEGAKSTAYVRLTSRYVDAGAAKLSEILLPIDDKPFGFGPTPDPDLVKQLKDTTPVVNAMGPVYKMPDPGAPPPPQAGAPLPPGVPPGAVPATQKDLAQDIYEAAEDAAEKAEKRIYDWMVECNYAAEARKVIHDAARIGVGVVKGPVPDVSRTQALTRAADGVKLQLKQKTVPVTRWIDPWNLFPDGACGENLHHGDHIFERDYLAPRVLKQLASQTNIGYLPKQIEKVLKEGPGKSNEDGGNPKEKKGKNRYEVWYFYGVLSRDDMAMLNDTAVKDVPEAQADVYAIVTMVNDTVIRAVLNPMESGRFPYHAMPWSRRAGSWAGVGVGEQVDLPQRMVNAGTRTLLNNAGLSAGVQLVMDSMAIAPADGSWTITPNKTWWKTGETDADDVRKIFMLLEFPNLQPQLMAVIDYGFKLAEEATNIPLVAQGRETEKMPGTFGEAQLLNTNAHTLLRSVANIYDDMITEPLVHAYYEWLLLDPSVPDEEKGDFQINAHGSVALVERAIQEQVLQQVGQMALQPAFGVDPKKWFAEMMRAKRLDPRKVQYTEQEMEKMAATPPPPPIQIAVEQLKGQNALQIQQAKSQAELQQMQVEDQAEQQRLANGQATPHMAAASARIEQERIRAQTAQTVEASRANAEQARADKELQIATQNGEFELQKMQLQKELAILDYTSKHNLTLEQTRTELAKTAMQEKTKRDLGAATMQLQQTEGNSDRLHDMSKHLTSLATPPAAPPNV